MRVFHFLYQRSLLGSTRITAATKWQPFVFTLRSLGSNRTHFSQISCSGFEQAGEIQVHRFNWILKMARTCYSITWRMLNSCCLIWLRPKCMVERVPVHLAKGLLILVQLVLRRRDARKCPRLSIALPT